MMHYPIRIDNYDMEEFGTIQYAQLMHPHYLENFETCRRDCWGFDASHVRALRKYIKPGDTVIDIGAQLGYVMIPMMLAASPGGTVLCFEPNQWMFKVLAKNAEINQHRSKILTFEKAVTEQPGRFEFHYENNYVNGGWVTSTGRGIGAAGCINPVNVWGVEMRGFLETEGIKLDRVSFIKIDTEGYDRKILKSIKWLIDEFKPVMRVEYFFELNRNEKIELYDMLVTELGYDIFWDHSQTQGKNRFITDGRVENLDAFLARGFVCDMLCFPKGSELWRL